MTNTKFSNSTGRADVDRKKRKSMAWNTLDWDIPPVTRNNDLSLSSESVDIVVCVHNALSDVQQCLSSIIRYTLSPYRLILVDDGSEKPVHEYLKRFSITQNAMLIHNESACGYTLAANQGLRASTANYVVLLNSDTVVSPDWLDRMLMCAMSDVAIGMVGPLSNTASWQSIPEIEENGDWATNALPAGISVERMSQWVAFHSAKLYPQIPFLNGFCLLIKRNLIEQVGHFDETGFGRGYGEENDYCLRARKLGWKLAIADDVYIFHAQSRSYSHEQRKRLCHLADKVLVAKHGLDSVQRGVQLCRENRVLRGIRLRARQLFDRHAIIARGIAQWEGLRVLFVLPVMLSGGGANAVISEARAMRAMGVDATILNLKRYRSAFINSYPKLDIPVIFVEREADFASTSTEFDAVVATANNTVRWLTSVQDAGTGTRIAYYIQDYEPNFYKKNSRDWQIAHDSYNTIPGMILFTKTAWNRDKVFAETGRNCIVVGPSYDVDLFMPRNRKRDGASNVVRICAMVRPAGIVRNAFLTMRVLRAIQNKFLSRVDIVVFGTDGNDPQFLELPRDFSFTNVGHRTPEQMAALLNEVDVFVDFSIYQAMGLTAMEAMSCGVATIVPQEGGAASFAQDGVNSVMVNTLDEQACFEALERLVFDVQLRLKLQQSGREDVVRYYPERAAYEILQTLFPVNR